MTLSTSLNTFLGHPAVQSLGWALLHFIWQGTVLAGLYFVANTLTRRSQAGLRYAIGCVAMLLMPVVFIATALWSEQSPISAPPAQHVLALSPDGPILNAIVVTATLGDQRPLSINGLAPTTRLNMFPGWMVCLWLAGVIALSIYTAVGWLRVRRLRRYGLAPVDPIWIQIIESLMVRLQVSPPVRLYISAIAEVPTVIGWLRPCILLPVSAVTGLGEAELRAVLAHELAHIRRCDYLVNLLQNAIETLLFYHPAVWWISRHIRQEREHCCDDLAVEVCGDVMLYANALAQLEELRGNIFEPALAVTGGDLLARIRRLTETRNERSRDRISGTLGAMLTLALVAGVLIGSGNAPTIHAQSPTARSSQSVFDASPGKLSGQASREVAAVLPGERSIAPQIAAQSPAQRSAGEAVVADVHVSARTINPAMRGGLMSGGRYELRTATMVDLIRVAYGVDAANVVGGPAWLDTDRFDVIAKAPSDATPEAQQLMLRSLLADRFKLAVHKDTKALTGYALTFVKSTAQLKQSKGDGDGGCSRPPESQDAKPGTLAYNTYSCHNMTMATLAQTLRMLAPGYFGGNPVVDLTGLNGSWDFEFRWTPRGLLSTAGSDGVSLFDSVAKLGLKLDLRQIPIPVVVVDSVNEKPTENPAGVTKSLPAVPREFEVADIKPSAPGVTQMSGGIQPGGRIDVRGMTLRALMRMAWNIDDNEDDLLVGGPKWLDVDRFDIAAKASAGVSKTGEPVDVEALQTMLRTLLTDRFKIATHSDVQPVTVYALVAAKPKLAKADPSNRTACRNSPVAANNAASVLSKAFTCVNVSMAQFADKLQGMAPGYIHQPVVDLTGLDGYWDFTLNFSNPLQLMAGGGRGGGAGEASDPNGAISLFEAIDKQLGLKLEQQKHPMPVVVIDHVEEKPTDN